MSPRKVRSFTDRHKRTGLVSNQDRTAPGWGLIPPFISTATCNRIDCIDRAIAYVESNTNETAWYQADSDYR